MSRQHQSLWEATASLPSRPRLRDDVEADVAVVGAGITGLSTALELQEAGLSVVVVEAEHVGSGATGHTSAHLSTLWDGGYGELLRRYDLETAARVARAMEEAIDWIGATVEALGLDCGFQRVPGFLYAEPGQSGDTLVAEFAAARHAGLAVTPAELPLPIAATHAFQIADQAQFHPLRYVAGLAHAVEQRGGRIFERSRVVDFADGAPCRLEVEDGGRVQSQQLVLATHLPPGRGPLPLEAAPYRSYVLAFSSAELPPDGLYWDAADPYHYARAYRDGAERWFVVGGADHKTGHGGEREALARLERYVTDRYAVERIAHRWSAQLHLPADRLPFIGRAPFARHSYVATGFSGDGLTLGTHAARMIAAEILGKEHRDRDCFRPSRLPTAGLDRLFAEGLDSARRIVGDRLGLERAGPALDALAPGEGCVVGCGLSPTAAYRDEHGDMRRFSAVCPHMKCVVQWNALHRTFDCPCHGSRFEATGELIHGPALRGLDPL